MLIVLPTYKRLDQLRWSLTSVLRAELPNAEPARVCVVSNHPASHSGVQAVIDSVVGTTSTATKWEIELFKREKTLDPVDNWYGAISEKAREGEVVFLHGDDDIILEWGLVHRRNALLNSGGTVLLTPFTGGLTFDGSECYAPEICRPLQIPCAEVLDFTSLMLATAPFMGSHAYVFNHDFREAVATSYNWCESQNWLSHNERTLFLPLYLPLAALYLGIKVIGMNLSCVVRGTELDEIVSAPYACRSWNNAYLYGAVYEMLSQVPMVDSELPVSFRHNYLRLASRGFATVIFDNRISWSRRKEWLLRFTTSCMSMPKEMIRSIRIAISQLLHLRKVRLKMQLRHKLRIPVVDWIHSLYSDI